MQSKEIKSKNDVIDLWEAILESGVMGIPRAFLESPFTPLTFTDEDIEKVDRNNDIIEVNQDMVDGFIDSLGLGVKYYHEHKAPTREYLEEKKKQMEEYEARKKALKEEKRLANLHRSISSWDQQQALHKKQCEQRRKKNKAARKARKK